ncbi:immunoglobulin-like domain-containing protein [Clostridium sp. CAG:265]|uniref:immunoglobulin-like domain-containing protein n=1 Tax=Clostridium sp. CAG:265 TaxID=1262787 RepID=UPI00033E42A4|nr:immunoglobulin-like domain-containing protein [Clostridium sp. CAG:265]CDB75807.1 insecticidal crystal protein CryET70 [Clostridium sp. CAG:265]
MKRKEILVLIGEVLGSRAVYSVASLVITISMLSGITIILRNDIRDIKNYVQSVVDKDPNYKEVHGQVSGSENVIRGNIDIESILAKEDKKTEDANTSSNISSGYDNYTPTQTVTGESSNKPSNIANNSSVSGETSSGITSNNKPLNNDGNVNTNDNTNNSNDSQKEEINDRSSFNGKDVMVSEGEPFNPMNALQLAATDINGKNITNKIVITENNVDTYKPGLYTVKANVTLSNENTLEKEFLVRVEPTILNLAVNDLKISKDILEKNEHFNLTFAVKSSKSYLEVASVNINNKDYTVNKVSSGSFLRKSDKYEVNLVAPVKGGTEKIQIKSVTMSDGTIVDIDKSIEIEILKEEAQITDVVIKNISNEQEKISLEYNLNDIDETIDKAMLYLYNEENIIIQQEELEKNNKSNIQLNINENGMYKVEIRAYYKEDINTVSDFRLEKELFVENIEVSKFNNELLNENEQISMASIDYEQESMVRMSISENEENNEASYRQVNINLASVEGESQITGLDNQEQTQDVKITGNVMDDKGNMPVANFKVTVPTSASFTVNKNGTLVGPSLQIKNEGTQTVEVYAQSFSCVGSGDINIVGEDVINRANNSSDISGALDRSTISLKLLGESQQVAYLGSNNGKSGVYNSSNLQNEVSSGIKLLTLNPGTESQPEIKMIRVEGMAGSKEISKAVSDKYTLTLKIKKKVNV